MNRSLRDNNTHVNTYEFTCECVYGVANTIVIEANNWKCFVTFMRKHCDLSCFSVSLFFSFSLSLSLSFMFVHFSSWILFRIFNLCTKVKVVWVCWILHSLTYYVHTSNNSLFMRSVQVSQETMKLYQIDCIFASYFCENWSLATIATVCDATVEQSKCVDIRS